ncbi:hypothetical protein VFPPC_18371 [Pochonia chlamydosporia 170]|uniref:Uncharacterized protein n=1 Tax=Pochonia chlamydosporia 170 TaxID=1380566 RepID=A0A219ANX4_METCM|nr:hypothetical protein VFPPC_18371 [Pochonia chlamydosporia 170]OWT42421.1 hypothetical protein VFPPC_18371 [Pochonia chlamydosporia 170]
MSCYRICASVGQCCLGYYTKRKLYFVSRFGLVSLSGKKEAKTTGLSPQPTCHVYYESYGTRRT